jgi:hypothetical protein
MTLSACLRFVKLNFEAFLWLVAIILLAVMQPENTQATLCLIHHAGIDSCPGCGLGHSMSAAFHGRFLDSFRMHPFGMAAIIILISRIVTIFYQYFKYQLIKTINHVENL